MSQSIAGNNEDEKPVPDLSGIHSSNPSPPLEKDSLESRQKVELCNTGSKRTAFETPVKEEVKEQKERET